MSQGIEEARQAWERQGAAEYQRYLTLRPEELIAEMRAGRYDEYHALWRAVAAKAPLELAGWPLFAVVTSDAPYLVRYHAAAALLSLLGSRRFVAADLAVESPGKQGWIGVVESELRARVGLP